MRVTMMLLFAVILAAVPIGCGDKKAVSVAGRTESRGHSLRSDSDEPLKTDAMKGPSANIEDKHVDVTETTTKTTTGGYTTKAKDPAPFRADPPAKEPKSEEKIGDRLKKEESTKKSLPVGGMGMMGGGMGMMGTGGMSGMGTMGGMSPTMGGMGKIGGPPPAPLTTPPAVAEAVAGTAKTPGGKITKKQDGPQSGILTAGSFDDNLDPAIFNSFVAKRAQRQSLGDLPGKMIGQRLMILVRDSSGKPIGDARVKLTAANGATAELTTRSDGKAIFMLPFDQLPVDQPLTATVAPPYNGQALTEKIMAGAQRWKFTVPNVQAQLPKNLDLAIVLDTTGSMQDEINHLKAEIRGICQAVQKKFPEVNQRFSLICYRDEGDEYVVRSFDFNASLDKFHDNIAAQSAAGGGDYPEAMHKGLEAANQLRWRERDTASVLFLIADAPPHAQHMNRTLAAANSLRKRGVAIYPVACSGYDDDCEFVMRSCALLTGSQFLFLTDDSGVGGAHAEPKIPYYSVERLEKLMVRMIASELSGQRVYPNPQDIIRSVGGKRVN